MKRLRISDPSMSAKKQGTTLVEMTSCALLTCLFCILAPLTIYLPFTPVGITLGTFCLYVCGGLFRTRLAFLSVAIYLLLGALSLPVFSGYVGGLARVIGPTGGYLIGYLPCVLVIATLANRQKKTSKRMQILSFVIAALLGTICLYTFGTVWFLLVYAKHIRFVDAITKCVLPFLPFDFIKIACATALLVPLKKRLRF